MQLNGWRRLWMFLTVLWTILAAAITWNTWPPTYLSTDRIAGIPIGADVTYLMDGVINAKEKITKSTFATRLKKKYPVYSDLSDDELVTRTLGKYPHYRQFISDLDWFQQNAPSTEQVNQSSQSSQSNQSNRRAAIRSALSLWLLPPLALYAFGAGVGWIYRGFRKS